MSKKEKNNRRVNRKSRFVGDNKARRRIVVAYLKDATKGPVSEDEIDDTIERIELAEERLTTVEPSSKDEG